MADAAKTAGEQRGRPFAKGRSGNPKGGPNGSRHRVSLLAERLLEADAEQITLAVIAAAKGGDSSAMRLCMERLAPVRRGRPISFDLPSMETAADVAHAIGRVACLMADGSLTVDEAQGIASVIELKRNALETNEHAERLAKIEEMLAEREQHK